MRSAPQEEVLAPLEQLVMLTEQVVSRRFNHSCLLMQSREGHILLREIGAMWRQGVLCGRLFGLHPGTQITNPKARTLSANQYAARIPCGSLWGIGHAVCKGLQDEKSVEIRDDL